MKFASLSIFDSATFDWLRPRSGRGEPFGHKLSVERLVEGCGSLSDDIGLLIPEALNPTPET
ncbi:MAG: hypothetical protein PVG06_06490 [Desulfobacterales bacterium]